MVSCGSDGEESDGEESDGEESDGEKLDDSCNMGCGGLILWRKHFPCFWLFLTVGGYPSVGTPTSARKKHSGLRGLLR
jgi:hypothetical protein